MPPLILNLSNLVLEQVGEIVTIAKSNGSIRSD